MKKLIELLSNPNNNVAIVSEDGHVFAEESTSQGLLEQMIIYRDQDEQEGWQDDTYTLVVFNGSDVIYRYHHSTSSAEVLVQELENEFKN